MDVLIFIAIFTVLPKILKRINENNKNKSGFNFDDIDLIKREFTKLKTSAEAKVRDTKAKEKPSYEKMEKAEVIENNMANLVVTKAEQISEFHKKEAAAYNLAENHIEHSNKNAMKAKEKIQLGINDKKELRRAIVMSEVLGKPRALKKFL